MKNHISFYNFGCHIVLHKHDYRSNDQTILKSFKNYNFHQYKKWNWFFRYYTARMQINYPKKLVELIPFKTEIIDQKSIEIKHLRNKLIRNKGIVTQYSKSIDSYLQESQDLFKLDNPYYLKALNKLNRKIDLVKQLESEIKALELKKDD